MKVIACIQSRMGSQRLENKALLKIQGKSAIEWIARRLKRAKKCDEIVLTTTDRFKDDVLERLAKKMGLSCFRGSETDLVQRLLGAARAFKADAIVRVTADCPLVDPVLVDNIISVYQGEADRLDFVTNTFPPTYPDGMDLEILPSRTLERLDREVTHALHREWLTTYILENAKDFRILNLSYSENLKNLRWTLDYPEDLRFMRRVFRYFSKSPRVFGMQELLALLKKHPELSRINENRIDKTVVRGIRSRAYHQLVQKETAALGEKI